MKKAAGTVGQPPVAVVTVVAGNLSTCRRVSRSMPLLLRVWAVVWLARMR
eukprot:COSAG06_NODE_2863_length_6158_cov_8.532761_2_plen_50_part_00